MARFVKEWTAEFGRDKGKKFRITEMAPRVSHDWATRLLLALSASVSEIDDGILSRGLAGVAVIFAAPGRSAEGVQSLVPALASLVGKMPVDLARQLMSELLDCVEVVFPSASRRLMDDDIEEVLTIAQLQREAFKLHIEPFTSGGLLTSGSAPTAQ